MEGNWPSLFGVLPKFGRRRLQKPVNSLVFPHEENLMKKLLAVVSCVLLASLVLFSCAKKEAANTDNSLKAVMDKKTFILGLDDSFPPLGFRDANNEIAGYDIDLAKESGKAHGR